MMVVLLIMTIILAAMAPVMTTRMSANKAVGGNSKSEIWKYVEDSGETDIYYGTTNNQRAMIGQNKAETAENARLILNTSDDIPNHIIFKKGVFTVGSLRMADEKNKYIIALGQNASSNYSLYYEDTVLGSIAIGTNASVKTRCRNSYDKVISALAIGTNATANGANGMIVIGKNATALNSPENAIAIGTDVSANGSDQIVLGTEAEGGKTQGSVIVIGKKAYATSLAGSNSIAIGDETRAERQAAIALGHKSTASDCGVAIGFASKALGIAIGSMVNSSQQSSIAIGTLANATGKEAVAIGYGAKATTANTIVLGTASETVQIPGSLTVATTSYPSDKKLKNIGKEYTSSLDKIKQLKPFNFTYKNDKNKTPHVGVIAQDLQKVFPNAVSKGKDGFLTIRMEDMFYAVINAIKELDAKITQMMKRESEKDKKIKDLEKRIEFLEQKLIQSP